MTPGAGHRPGDPAGHAGGIEAPVRPVLAGRRGLRGRIGLTVVPIVAIAVIAAGLGFGLGTDRQATPSASLVARATSPSPVPTRRVAPTPDRTEPLPTSETGEPCRPVSSDTRPVVRLTAWTGGNTASGTAQEPDQATASGGPNWPVPLYAVLADPGSPLVLTATASRCFTMAEAEFVAADDPGGDPLPLMDPEVFVPPRTQVEIPQPPAGDWVIRVIVAFSGDTVSPLVPSEQFFRVTNDARPDESPLMTPTVACRPLGPGDPLPDLVLVGDGEVTVLGVDPIFITADSLARLPRVRSTFPEALQIRPAGDACATSWSLEFHVPGSSGSYTGTMVENPGERLGYIAQDRIDVTGAPLGPSTITAAVHFGPLRTVRAVWALDLDGPDPPAAVVTAPDGRTVPAVAGCGTGWTLLNGMSAYDYCDDPLIPDGTATLDVQAGDVVTLDLADWAVTSWYATCGVRSSSEPAVFEQPVDCNLGSWGTGEAPVGPGRFIALPGDWMIMAWVSGLRDGDTVYASYFFELDARE